MYNKDEWIIVKTHSKHSFNPNRLKVKSSDKNKISYEKMYNDSKKTMEEIDYEIVSSAFYLDLLNLIQNQILPNLSSYKEISIKCLGLGKIIGNEISLYQILFSKRLFLDLESIFTKKNQRTSLYIYDPVMNEEDHKFLFENLKEFNLTKNDVWMIEENENFSFYIMIHCEKELYQKVVSGNKLNIQNIAIIGNSLMKYNENLDLIQKPQIKIFKECSEKIKEHRLKDFEQMFCAFNDSFLIEFFSNMMF